MRQLVPCLLALLAPPAAAQPDIFPFRDEIACFARSYDASHLERHPRQVVSEIALYRDRDIYVDPDAREAILLVTVRLRPGNRETTDSGPVGQRRLVIGATCGYAGPDTMECAVRNGEGGIFLLTLFLEQDYLLLEPADMGFDVAGANGEDDLWRVHPDDDQARFRLNRTSAGECQRRLETQTLPE